ncbi:MAG: hypothetical protein ACXQTR_02485 [Candidatus Methanospirareceae archaeon]
MGKTEKKKKYCISCGCELSGIENEICIGCALIGLFGGNTTELKEAQKEVWVRCLHNYDMGRCLEKDRRRAPRLQRGGSGFESQPVHTLRTEGNRQASSLQSR